MSIPEAKKKSNSSDGDDKVSGERRALDGDDKVSREGVNHGDSTTPPAASKATKTSTTAPASTSVAAAPVVLHHQDSQQHQQQQQQQAVATAAVAGAPGYSEWAAAFQAYYQAGAQPPAGFPHPYMWAGQPMMPPPYGGPHPTYGAMYPPGAMYAHPMYGQYGAPPQGGEAMAMAGGEQTESKPEAKDGGGGKVAPLRRSKGSRGSLQLLKVGTDGGAGKQQRNGVSHSSNGEENETGSDGSTEGSRDENEQNMLPKRRFIELMAMEGGGTGGAAGGGGYMVPPGGVIPGTPSSVGVGGQAGGSLDMSLDYWSAGSVPAVAKPAKQQLSGSPTTNGPPTELWLHDERELKRQRRKQSNRESARRSRLRKQAECEELETRVDTLTVENVTLRAELTRVTEECKRLQGENESLMQQLRTSPASDAIPAIQSAAATKEIHATDKEMIDAAANMGNGNVLSKADKASGLRSGDERSAAT